ncbi:Zinc finger matrin-type protein 5 [Chionoecetes opilio]|uniref:Zinc finger matrin-type protein 5 n=1 Tax=Chionoecetes opilio TaxID=41210 RepID=A0A8J5CSM1_CHIOP|nr:Zinc finger matrin-type protein 5 [Chionoecetes opilio]
MVKRYYCDFCDNSYPYSTEAFRKHRTGHHHIKLRNSHYDKFKNARDRLKDELTKEKCRRFLSGQDCSFGEGCIFSHLTPPGTQALQQQALEEEEQERWTRLPAALREGREVSVEAWLTQRRVPLTSDTLPGPPLHTLPPLNTPLPPTLASAPNLPPSLAPTTLESWLGVEFAQWG